MIIGGKRKRFPVSGAIEVGQPGAGTELDADFSINRKGPTGEDHHDSWATATPASSYILRLST